MPKTIRKSEQYKGQKKFNSRRDETNGGLSKIKSAKEMGL